MSGRKHQISRRALLKAGAAISVFPAPAVWAQTTEPLRIGFLTVLTGPLAAGGKQQEEGAALFLKERNGMIAGRKVELITQDTAGQPALAKTKLQELVERSKVHVSIGPLATNEALAMDGYVRDSKVPLIDYHAEVLKRRPNDWNGAGPKFKEFAKDVYQVPTLISGDGVHPSYPKQHADYSADALSKNGFQLRSVLTLRAYADVITRVLAPKGK